MLTILCWQFFVDSLEKVDNFSCMHPTLHQNDQDKNLFWSFVLVLWIPIDLFLLLGIQVLEHVWILPVPHHHHRLWEIWHCNIGFLDQYLVRLTPIRARKIVKTNFYQFHFRKGKHTVEKGNWWLISILIMLYFQPSKMKLILDCSNYFDKFSNSGSASEYSRSYSSDISSSDIFATF